jgi:hypothetical protein
MNHAVLMALMLNVTFTETYGFTNPTLYDTINVYDAGKYTARTDIPAAIKKTLIKTPDQQDWRLCSGPYCYHNPNSTCWQCALVNAGIACNYNKLFAVWR